jgi:hypothetical protein
MTEPREYTGDECRAMLLDQIATMVRYWHRESRAPTPLAKMNGLVHSVLTILDGGSALPAFDVTTAPHPDDAEYLRGEGENWWPTGVDIAGGLHDHWPEFEPKETP